MSDIGNVKTVMQAFSWYGVSQCGISWCGINWCGDKWCGTSWRGNRCCQVRLTYVLLQGVLSRLSGQLVVGGLASVLS